MFSINSFHDLVIPIWLNLNGSEELSCNSSFLFSISAAKTHTLKDVTLLHCHHVKVYFFSSGSSRPTIQGTCDSLLLLSGNPITPTIYLSRSHSILCLCLFNTQWSCLPGIGCLRCDAERFPIDGMERIGRREGRVSGGFRIEGERRRGRVDGQAKCFGPESIEVDYLPQKETSKVEWKLKGLQWRTVNSFFMRNCTVLHQRIEPQCLNLFYYKRQ